MGKWFTIVLVIASSILAIPVNMLGNGGIHESKINTLEGRNVYYSPLDSNILQLKRIFPDIAVPMMEDNFLSMELSSFNVESIENKYVLVDWSTREVGFKPDSYIIQRWTNDMGWVDIQRIKGERVEGKRVMFSFLDRNPVTGNSFYRLKHEDVAGNTYSTDIQAVIMYDRSRYLFQQNVEESTALLVCTDANEKLDDIKIFDMEGNLMNDQITIEQSQKSQAIIKMKKLKTGMYLIKANSFLTKIFKI